MQAKGTAVGSIPLFVKTYHAAQYQTWYDSLTPKAKEVFKEHILASSWYPLHEAVIEPTQKICDLFYNGSDKGAWKAGEFSAEHSLKGIYKIFVKVGTPQFIIKRASNVFSSFYNPSKIEVIDTSSNHVNIHISEFPTPSAMVECRIAGWIQQALTISGCKTPNVKITTSMTKGSPYTEIASKW